MVHKLDVLGGHLSSRCKVSFDWPPCTEFCDWPARQAWATDTSPGGQLSGEWSLCEPVELYFRYFLSMILCLFTFILCINTHTHTHLFNGPLSRNTWVSRYQNGKTNLDFTEARDSEWQWHQLGHMQVCTLLQPDNHSSTPPLSFLQARCHSCHPANSIKAQKAQFCMFKSKYIVSYHLGSLTLFAIWFCDDTVFIAAGLGE